MTDQHKYARFAMDSNTIVETPLGAIQMHDPERAEWVLRQINYAYFKGVSDTQEKMRTALGLPTDEN